MNCAGLGIAFEDLTSSARGAILTFVGEHPPLFYDVEAVLDESD